MHPAASTSVNPVALRPEERRTVRAIALSAVTVLTMAASFNYVINHIVADLDATSTQTDTLRQVPSIAALLVVFLAGVLGQRFGERRAMLFSTVIFSVGALVATVAPVIQLVTLGFLLTSIGQAVMIVVALAYVSEVISDKDARASAFATFSSVEPVAYLVMPLLAGVLLSVAGWRWVAASWVVFGLLGTFAVWRLIPARRRPPEAGPSEMLTPALAGVVLASFVQLLTLLPKEGIAPATVAYLLALGLAIIALTVAMRRMSAPSLSFDPLRRGGLVLLLVVSILTLFANLGFYMTLSLQYVYGMSPLQVAVAFIPVNLAAIAGARLAGVGIQHWGLTATGAAAVALTGLSLGASALIGLGWPLWALLTIVGVYYAGAIGAMVALTNAVMDLVPDHEAGLASSYRSAASHVGSAIGVAGMTAIVTAAVMASIQAQASAAHIDATTYKEVAKSTLGGASSENVASTYAVPLDEVQQIDNIQRIAFLDGLHAQGGVGMVVSFAAAGLFVVARRRALRPA